MFGFRKRKEGPKLCRSNPGIGYFGRVELPESVPPRRETLDVVQLTGHVLRRNRNSVLNEKSFLVHKQSGFILQPQIVSVSPAERGGVRTTTTMQINHSQFAPDGVFEYQHSTGETVEAAVLSGIEEWFKTDFVTLLDALQPDRRTCTSFQKELPATADRPALKRRVVFGPPGRFFVRPPSAPPPKEAEEHPFCPCCFFTHSLTTFDRLMESDALHCLRLYAARDHNGEAQVDCRVNGEDWEPGAKALRSYVATWPENGVEFRKQYVVLHTMR